MELEQDISRYDETLSDFTSDEDYQETYESSLQEVRIEWSPQARLHCRNYVKADELEDWSRCRCYQVFPGGAVLRAGMDVELEGRVFVKIHDILLNPSASAYFLRGKIFLLNGRKWTPRAKKLLVHDDEEMSRFLLPLPNEVHCMYNILEDSPFASEYQQLRIFPMNLFVRTRKIITTNRNYPELNPDLRYNLNGPNDVLVCRWTITKLWRTAKSRESSTLSHCARKIKRISSNESDPKFAIDDLTLMAEFRGLTDRRGSGHGIHISELNRRRQEALQLRKAKIMRNKERRQLSESIVIDSNFTTGLHDPSSEYLLLNDDYEHIQDSHYAEADPFWRLTNENASPMVNTGLQRYTLGDIFSGCGGVAVAAVAAGLQVRYAVDYEPNMCATYLLNNPATRVACTDAKTFLSQYAYSKKVDILHLSFPCQPFSKAHTTPGRNDQQNRDALGTLTEYLYKAQPRIVTIEEADALGTFKKHANDLKWIVRQLTIVGFSVELQILNFAHYGIGQTRNRLVVVASCPGQRLPGLPERTHGDSANNKVPGLLPWVSPRSAIDDIPAKWKHHDRAAECLLVESEEWSPQKLCPTIITRSSGLVHFEGFRRFTVMEKLKMQGFPLFFEFPEGQTTATMEKQIGNAVPPKAFEVILRHIRTQLLQEDEDFLCRPR